MSELDMSELSSKYHSLQSDNNRIRRELLQLKNKISSLEEDNQHYKDKILKQSIENSSQIHANMLKFKDRENEKKVELVSSVSSSSKR